MMEISNQSYIWAEFAVMVIFCLDFDHSWREMLIAIGCDELDVFIDCC